jgi:hypothetical protein
MRLVGGGSPVPKPAAGDAQASESPGGSAYARHSHGLEQFFSQVQGPGPLCILDVGGATQANVEFITSLGHRLYSEDFLRVLDASSGPDLQTNFLKQNLGFPAGCFDGVLLWDVLEFLPQPLLKATVERLYQVAKPGSYLLAFFHADEKAVSVPVYSYRISDDKTLLLAHRQLRRPAQLFNNRAVERLFQAFESVKFFLTRDHLREVIVRR